MKFTVEIEKSAEKVAHPLMPATLRKFIVKIDGVEVGTVVTDESEPEWVTKEIRDVLRTQMRDVVKNGLFPKNDPLGQN